MFPLDSPWNISFAGCGFLGIYHVGVASCLQEQAPFLVENAQHVYGASAGALTASALVSGACMATGAQIIDVAKEARKRFLGPMHPSFNVVKIMRTLLLRMLPPDAYSKATGKLGISLTRVTDGENVLVSHFSCNEELVQACVCSTFIPVYSGLIPPTFQGVRYVDGGISDNLPQYELKNTITVSPFSGESDICPRDASSTNLHELRFTNTSIQFTLSNLYRVSRALFPPDVMKTMCEQGYKDALRFLKKNAFFLAFNRHCCPQKPKKGLCCVHVSTLVQIFAYLSLSLKSLHLSLSFSLSLHLALVEACRERQSPLKSLSNMFPIRMLSTILLPYTLPLESALSQSIRLLEWLPDVQEDVGWIKEQTVKVLKYVLHHAIPTQINTLNLQTYPQPTNISTLIVFLPLLRLSNQLSLRHSQSAPAASSAASLLPGWVSGGSSSMLDAIQRLEQYQRQLFVGLACINLDLRGSFCSGPTSPTSTSTSTSTHPATQEEMDEGLTMRPVGCPISTFHRTHPSE
uniref:triacylglycerol lipase n=1 Tax=Electrophorus electricus TaxID=8005 RepID=A0A4W4E8U6_ELEEL